MKKKLFCILSTNGAGKTTLMKWLIKKYHYFDCKIYKDGSWAVLRNGDAEDKAIVVGHYTPAAVTGGDLIRKTEIFLAIRKAAEYPATKRIVVETLKFHKEEIFSPLKELAAELDLDFYVILVSADPIECFYRVLQRNQRTKYNVSLIMERLAQAKWRWATMPENRRFLVRNSNERSIDDVGKELAEIIFR